MIKDPEFRHRGTTENPFTVDHTVDDKKFSKTVVYHDGPYVVVESLGFAPKYLTWQEALTRAAAISEAVKHTQSRDDMRLLEDTIAAIREARKVSEANWKPPISVSMYQERKPPSVVGPFHEGIPKNPD